MSEMTNHIIDEYLLGRLDGEQLERLEQQLASDSDFAQRVEERKTLMDKVDAYGDYQIKKRLTGIRQKEMTRRSKIIRIKIWKYLVAAAILLGFIWGTWYWNQPTDPQHFFADYYEAYELSFAQRTDQMSAPLAEANRLYAAEQYEQALPLIDQVFRADTSQSKLRLARAICQIEIGEYEAARQDLQSLLQTDFDPFQEQARWYLALIELHQNKLPAARQQLQLIINDPKAAFHQQALELYAQL